MSRSVQHGIASSLAYLNAAARVMQGRMQRQSAPKLHGADWLASLDSCSRSASRLHKTSVVSSLHMSKVRMEDGGREK